MHLFIITGSSRGLGAAMARQLHRADHVVLGIARRRLAELDAPGIGAVEQWEADLSDPAPVARQLQAWLEDPQRPTWQSATLVNNAALLSDPGPLADSDPAQLSAALRVGLEAPALLCRAFLAATDGVPRRRIMNISSGLGRRAMAGVASYCAIKAGLDHLSRALALEEPGVGIVSIAPGVIDSDMQQQLRGADPGRFTEQERFQSLKEGGQLQTAEATATALLRYLDRPDYGQQVIADIREA